jgi:hypothetical protein
MGVAGAVYDTAMVEAALFRSGGVRLENYAYGPATNPDPAAGFRKYVASGKGVGHVYVHTEGGGDDTYRATESGWSGSRAMWIT